MCGGRERVIGRENRGICEKEGDKSERERRRQREKMRGRLKKVMLIVLPACVLSTSDIGERHTHTHSATLDSFSH